MIALYKCLLFIVSAPIILSPYTLNSFIYFIFLVLDTIGKSQSTDRIVVEHFPCHSKNTLLKKQTHTKALFSQDILNIKLRGIDGTLSHCPGL